MVELLLRFGANPLLAGKSGSSVKDMASSRRDFDALKLVGRYEAAFVDDTTRRRLRDTLGAKTVAQ